MGRLSKVIVQNFKSYAGHQVIGPFDDYNFVCVIGPNGAGKSNLMDAISFVVGVSTDTLRGGSLTDLEYNGKADAAAGLPTYVALVYADEGEETMFMRTIKGESSVYQVGSKDIRSKGEFPLQKVSFSAYSEQLRAIGLHAKARNFLVFQNEITAIASRSPLQLTALLERVSGSEEFAKDYDEMEKKMNAAREAAVQEFQKHRIIHQKKKLFKDQKKEAEQFTLLQQQLAEAKLVSTLFELYRLDSEIEEHIASLLAENSGFEAAKTNEDTIQTDMDAIEKQKAKADKECVDLQKQIALEEKAIAKLQEPKYKSNERVKSLSSKETQKLALLDRAKAEGKHRDSDVKELKAKLKAVTDDIDRLHAKMGGGGRLQGRDRDEYNALKQKADEQAFAVHQTLHPLKQDLAALRATLLRHENERRDLEKSVSQLRESLSEAERSLQEVQTTSADTTKAVQEKRRQFHAAQARRVQAEKDKQKIMIEFEKKQTELAKMRGISREDEREKKFSESVERMKELHHGVYGRISEMCKPRKDDHKLAISVAFGKYLDAIVVKTEAAAIECIEYRKRERLPPATFLPLDTIQAKVISPALRQAVERPSVKFVVDCVEYPHDIKRALEFALGDTLLINSLDEARKVCFAGQQRFKAVTLDGTLVRKSGIMTGGAVAAGQSQRWDAALSKSKLSALKAEREQLGGQLEAVDVEALMEAERRLHEDLVQLETSTKNRAALLADLEATVTSRRGMIADQEKKITKLATTIDAAREKIARQEAAVGAQEAAAHAIEDQVFKSLCARLGVGTIRELQADFDDTQQMASDMQKLVAERSRLQASINVKTTSTAASPEEIKKEIDKIKEDQKAAAAERDRIVAEMEKHEEKIKSLKKDREAKRLEAETLTKELKHKGNEKKQMQEDRNKAKNKVEMKKGQVMRLVAAKKNMINERSLEQIDLPLAQDDQMEDDDIDRGVRVSYTQLPKRHKRAKAEDEIHAIRGELSSSIASLTEELSKLRPNLKAGELLDGAEDELAQASSGLEAARVAAKEAEAGFNEVKEKRTRAFNEAFEFITNAISGTYSALTTETDESSDLYGGSAYLQLDNPAEPYKGGVRFDTIPPGKKFMDMEHLSGGEKSVAALALLFSIHAFRPSPFLVLDEVDAALDARNIDKVTRYLRSRRDMQAIIISLKENFYDKASALVGILRDPQEAFSRTLTLNLQKYQPRSARE